MSGARAKLEGCAFCCFVWEMFPNGAADTRTEEEFIALHLLLTHKVSIRPYLVKE